jgi:hypothetical protein
MRGRGSLISPNPPYGHSIARAEKRRQTLFQKCVLLYVDKCKTELYGRLYKRSVYLEDTLSAVRRARAINAVKLIQQQSIKNGLNKITLEEINTEIAMSRKERKK